MTTDKKAAKKKAGNCSQCVRCDLCGVDDAEPLIEKQGAFYVRCRRCGFIYSNPQFSDPLDVNREYFQENMQAYIDTHHVATKKQRRHARVIKMLEPYRQTNRILEVGCNTGGFVSMAQQMGWQATGIELVEDLVRYGREEKGLDLICGTLEEADLSDNEFDAVFSNAVIEHLASPASMLDQVLRVLRPGGVVYTRTLNYDSHTADMCGDNWRLLAPAGHPSIFTSDTLQRFHKNAGLEILSVCSGRVHVPRRGNGLCSRALKRLFLNLLVHFTLRGDRVAVLARKPKCQPDAGRQETKEIAHE